MKAGPPSLTARVEPAWRTAQRVREGRETVRACVERALARLADVQGSLNLCTQTLEGAALAHAARVQARVDLGEDLPLAGAGFVIKDNIVTGRDLFEAGDGLGPGGKTTCASRMLLEYVSPFTATAVARLMQAGAVPIAKVNLDEFGFGASTERSAFGPTRNPWDVSKVPGGSSGASAAAVAAGVCPLALGSDTGGSIRQPAAFCGVVGLKPTYGRVSRRGLVAFASSLDQIGPIAGSVRDAALALRVCAGHDPLDATSSRQATQAWDAGVDEGLPRGARVAMLPPLTGADHPACAQAMKDAATALTQAGVVVEEIDRRELHAVLEASVAAYYVIASAEASSNLARFDGVRYGHRAGTEGLSLAAMYEKVRGEGFGPEVKRRILLGTHVLRSGYVEGYYDRAQRVRARMAQEFASVLEGRAALLMPVTPGPAFGVGEKTSDPMALYLEDVYTVGVSLAGLPAVSLPAGWAGHLPVGVQLVGRAFGEDQILRAARLVERARTAADGGAA